MDLKVLLIVASMLAAVSSNSKDPKRVKRAANYPVPKQNWNLIAKQTLEEALKVKPINKVAKNVILFLGDGMGISTVVAARILKGQMNGQSGEENFLTFEKFPHVALSKTYCADKQVPDSASTASAYLCGEKVNMETIGVNENVKVNDPSNVAGNELTSIAHWSQDEGKSTGIISTTRVTHASPAASYAHVPQRTWEGGYGEFEFEAKQHGVPTIAEQLVHGETGKRFNVALGGGRAFMTPTGVADVEYPSVKGARTDGKNLINEWMDVQKEDGRTGKYVYNKAGLKDIDYDNVDSILGVFHPYYMNYELERPDTEPSIVDMTEAAIKLLSKNDKGYFLFVEGGKVDKGHHATLPKHALTEAVMLDNAVEKAMEMVNLDETLIIVTADHSHTFVIQGYAPRGNNILGLVPGTFGILDEKPYPTLAYTNGPNGLMPGETRKNLTGVDIDDKDYVTQTLIPNQFETHGGEDVGIYAQGPMSHLFHGVHEEHYIAHLMAYASCVGRYKDNCARQVEEEEKNKKKKTINLDKLCLRSRRSSATFTKPSKVVLLTGILVIGINMLKWS